MTISQNYITVWVTNILVVKIFHMNNELLSQLLTVLALSLGHLTTIIINSKSHCWAFIMIPDLVTPSLPESVNKIIEDCLVTGEKPGGGFVSLIIVVHWDQDKPLNTRSCKLIIHFLIFLIVGRFFK